MEDERPVMHYRRTGTAKVTLRAYGETRRKRNVALDDEEVMTLLDL